MALPTLADAQAHLRVSGDEDKVGQCLAAAIGAAADYLGRPIPWLDEGGFEIDVPEPVHAAILLITASLYDERHIGRALLQYPSAEAALLHPYRLLGV